MNHNCHFFLHIQNFWLNFSLHRKCVNRYKIGFSTKQRKLKLNIFCNKTTQKSSMPQQNSMIIFYSIHLKFLHILNFSTYKISPHLKFSTSKISPHDTKFSPWTMSAASATNMKYVLVVLMIMMQGYDQH